LTFVEFFEVRRFLRSTLLGSLIMASGVGVGYVITPGVEMILWTIWRSDRSKVALIVSIMAIFAFGVVGRRRSKSVALSADQKGLWYDPSSQPRMLMSMVLRSDREMETGPRYICDADRCYVSGPEDDQFAGEGAQRLQQGRQWRSGHKTRAIGILCRRMAFFVLPSFGLMLTNMTMTAIDKIFVGQVSYLELAAMGATGTVFDCSSYLTTFLNTAVLSLLGQALASNDETQVNMITSHALIFAMGIAFVLNGFLFLFAPFLALLVGAEIHMLPAAIWYLRFRALGGPVERIISMCTSFCIARQDGRTPLLMTLVGMICNCFCNWVLVWKCFPNAPAAATAGGSSITAVVTAVLMFRRLRARGWFPNPLVWPETWRASMPFLAFVGPVFLLLLIKSFSLALMTAFSTGLGDVAGAAHQVLLTIFLVFSVAVAQPLSWAAQSFLPRYCQVATRSSDEGGTSRGGSRGKIACLQALLVTCMVCSMAGGLAAACSSLPFGIARLFTMDQQVLLALRGARFPMLGFVLVYPYSLALEGCLIVLRRLDLAMLLSALWLTLNFMSLTLMNDAGNLTLASVWIASTASLSLSTLLSGFVVYRCIKGMPCEVFLAQRLRGVVQNLVAARRRRRC